MWRTRSGLGASTAGRDPRRSRRRATRRRLRSSTRRTGEILLANVVSSQADLHARYGGVVPEVASRRHLELVDAGHARGARRGGRDARRRRPRRRHAGPGPDRRAARRRRRREGARLVAAAAARAGRPPARPRRLALPRAGPLEPPFLCLLASGGHTMLLDVQRAARLRACSARRSTTPPARRSTRARACSGSAIRAARDRPARARRRPRGVRLPRRARPRARLLLLRAEDGAALRVARPRAERARRSGAPTSPRSTSGRSSARSSATRPRGGRREPDRGRRRRRRELGAARRAADAALAPLALCTDNAAMIASAARYVEPVPYPGYLGARCVRVALSRGCTAPRARRGRRDCRARSRPAAERRAAPRRRRAPPAGAGSSARGRASRSASA